MHCDVMKLNDLRMPISASVCVLACSSSLLFPIQIIKGRNFDAAVKVLNRNFMTAEEKYLQESRRKGTLLTWLHFFTTYFAKTMVSERNLGICPP